MTPEQAEEAERLLAAARSDLRAAKLLSSDPEQGNDVIGCHAQQAVEKALKPVLVALGTEIPYTHELSFLLEILADHPITVSDSVALAAWLTPWAVAARYGTSSAALDRSAAVAVAADSVTWAEALASDDR